MLTPSRKGAIAEAVITAEAAKLGVDVYRPVAEGGRYDLIFDTGERLLRVQCKWAVVSQGAVAVRTRTCRRGPGGSFIRSTYGPDEVDAIAAYCAETDKCYFIPIARFAGRKDMNLRLAPARNNQRAGIHWARLYEFGSIEWESRDFGAIAQLGERVSGTHEVAGSSPASSTSKSRPSGRLFAV
jgi:PD-(D/E)XK endonuclease